jgi:hypothetical protein
VDLYPEDWEPSADEVPRRIGRSHLAGMTLVAAGLVLLAVVGIYAVSQFLPLVFEMLPIPLDY